MSVGKYDAVGRFLIKAEKIEKNRADRSNDYATTTVDDVEKKQIKPKKSKQTIYVRTRSTLKSKQQLDSVNKT